MAGTAASETPTNTDTPALRRRISDELHARGRPGLDEEEEMNDEEEREIEEGVKINVFDHCSTLVEKGDVIQYDIDRNGSFVATKFHPYSWEKLQSEFGEGHYRVQAKSAHTKAYRKQESRFVSAPVKTAEEKQATIAEQIRAATPPQPDKVEELMKVATLIKSLTPALPTPPPPPEDKSATVMLEMMKFVTEQNNKAQENVMRMMEKMQENTTKLIERMDSSNKEVLNKLEAKIADGGSKNKSMDALQVVQMLQKAEERGMLNFMKIDELAERKAARMGGGKDDEDKEPQSATERLITAALPAISAALANKAPAQPPNLSRPVPPRVVRPAIPAVPNPPPARQPGQPQPGQPRAPGQQPAQPGQPVVLPKMTKEQVVEQISAGIFQRLIEAESVKGDNEKVLATQKQAALDVEATVKRIGITVPQLLQMIPQGDMIDIATSAGLPVEAHHWLKGFYANLTELAGPPTTVTPQPPRQPQAPSAEHVHPQRAGG